MKYNYQIYPIDHSFYHSPENYIFAKEIQQNEWQPVYIVQTIDLGERLFYHVAESCARRNGATHIHIHPNFSQQVRLAEEKDLILQWNPVCNER